MIIIPGLPAGIYRFRPSSVSELGWLFTVIVRALLFLFHTRTSSSMPISWITRTPLWYLWCFARREWPSSKSTSRIVGSSSFTVTSSFFLNFISPAASFALFGLAGLVITSSAWVHCSIFLFPESSSLIYSTSMWVFSSNPSFIFCSLWLSARRLLSFG